MVMFTDDQYNKLIEIQAEQKRLVERFRGNTITDQQKYHLSLLTRSMNDALRNCQR